VLCCYTREFALIALVASVRLPVAAAPDITKGSLSGTWRVSRSCLSGCLGSSSVTEVVRPHGNNVYMATGGLSLVLYQIGTQVLVHGAKTSSLLTIRQPGLLMSGSSVGEDGSTSSSTWRCVGPPKSTGYTSGTRIASTIAGPPEGPPGARAFC